MNKLLLLSWTGVIVISVFSGCIAHKPVLGDPLENSEFFQKLRHHWKDVKMAREYDHWRAPEVTPAPLLCRTPAATGVWVSCDRWPDGSDTRRFSMDAIRLSGAETEHEKALAVYRWVRRWTVFTNKEYGAPVERLARRLEKNPCIHEPCKVLNVYGSHWCGGQARTVEMIWRALGYRAEKICRGGHTIVALYYRDYDGMKRWHGLDVSHSAVAWHDSYKRLMSLNELSSHWYSFYYQYGFPGNGHIYFPTHRMELALRLNEKLERIWGNWGKPYQDSHARLGSRMEKKVPRYERGPYYPVTFGNGRWIYRPDLSSPGWEDGLAKPSEGMARGKLQPAEAGRAASAVWHFRTPYIVSDAAVEMEIHRKSAHDTIRLYLSLDKGRTWKKLWECPDEKIARTHVSVPICEKFKVTEKGKAPTDLNSPFGRYAFQLKLELTAEKREEDCRVLGIVFNTVVQQNMLALPQLQPGKNRITVRGELPQPIALKVTYIWDDPAGKGRRNETVIEKTPYTYEIIAAGKKWEDCICRSILVEAVPATGKGNQTLVKEKPSEIHTLPPMSPVEETMGRWNSQPLRRELAEKEKILKAIGDAGKFKRVLRDAVMVADPRMFDTFKEIALNTPSANEKFLAFAGMYRSDPEKARPILLEILNDREGRRVKWDRRKDTKDEGWGRLGSWCIGGTIIGYIAADAGWREFLPGLLRVLACKECTHYWGPRYGTVRVIGLLGKGDRDAALTIKKVLTHAMRKESGDTLIPAALAAGQIGDPLCIPALRKYAAGGYWPLKHNAALSLSLLGDRSIIPRMREWLTVKFDENYRGYAAEALGNLRAQEAVPDLRKALKIEPFLWVREKIKNALTVMKKTERVHSRLE